MLTGKLKIYVILTLFVMFSTLYLTAQNEKEIKKNLFPPDDPISKLILNTFLLPVSLLPSEKEVEPQITEGQEDIYNMEEIPISFEQDITLLVDKKTDLVEYLWSQKDRRWVEAADPEIRRYLQSRYENRGELREQAKKHRVLKDMQTRLDEMRQDTMGAKGGESRPVQ